MYEYLLNNVHINVYHIILNLILTKIAQIKSKMIIQITTT